MNDIEKAIEDLKESVYYRTTVLEDTRKLAIQALQEKAEYEKYNEALRKEYGDCPPFSTIVKFFTDYIQGQQDEPLNGFRILTNQEKTDYEQWKAERENPKPLPYGTLKELNCKPVYIVDHKSPVNGWYIVGSNEWFADGYSDYEAREDYCNTWFAYDREPKEADK